VWTSGIMLNRELLNICKIPILRFLKELLKNLPSENDKDSLVSIIAPCVENRS
jgi:hypothetical protein